MVLGNLQLATDSNVYRGSLTSLSENANARCEVFCLQNVYLVIPMTRHLCESQRYTWPLVYT